MRERKLLERSLRHGCAVHAVAFCPEGRRLATAGNDHVARLWDLATGSVLANPLRHDGPVHTVAFSSDGKMVATAASDGTMRRWDAWTGEPIGEPTRSRGAIAVSFSPDGSILAAISAAGEPVLWNAATGKPLHQPDGHRRPVSAIAFAPDGTTIAVAHDDGDVCLREVRSGRPIGEPLAHGSAVQVLEFDAGGEMLLTGTQDGEVCLWDIARHVAVVTMTDLQPDPPRGVPARLEAPSRRSATTARLDSGNPRQVGRSANHSFAAHGSIALRFGPMGRWSRPAARTASVRLWCAATGLPIGRPLAQGGVVRTLAFSPDGRRLASGGTDTTVRCWKLPNPVEGTAERVSCWVSVTTDLEFDTGDAIRQMDGATSWDLRRRLGELGGAPLR